MKKLLVFVLTVLLLAACSGDIYEADTAEMAVLNLQKDFVKDLTELQLTEVSDTQQFGVFKASIQSAEPEVFAVYLEKKEEKWRVMEALAIGHESKDDLPPAKGEFIKGELIKSTSEQTEVQQEGDKYVFKLSNIDKAVTVEFK